MEVLKKRLGAKISMDRTSTTSISSSHGGGGSRRSSIFSDLMFLLRRSSGSRSKLNLQQKKRSRGG